MTPRILPSPSTLLAAALCLAPALLQAGSSDEWDGLVEVKAKRMDAVFLAPGADFRPYTKIIADPTEVAFQKDWMKSMNRPSGSLSSRITEEDAAEILAAARSNFADIFHEAFTKAGYQVVTTPGPDVMRVSTAVVNLYLNAPDTLSPGRSRTYSANAGEATLVLEVRDSSTNALLGRVFDRRETLDSGMLQQATQVSNVSDFRYLFKRWADNVTRGLAELKEHSPVPADLEPKQKL